MIQEYSILFLKFAAFYFLGINLLYGVLMVLSWLKVNKYKKESLSSIAKENPSVSFIIPAFNEESLIVETLQTYLSLPQVNKEIIVVNDGSHDKTFKMLQNMFQLRRAQSESNIFKSITYPELTVIEAPHNGKAFSLNIGIKHAQYNLVCTMDADTIPTARGVEACLSAFAQDDQLVAAGGIIHVLNSQILKNNAPLLSSKDHWLTNFQSLEYLRTFLCVRLGWSLIGSTSLISGAFCMMKKDAWKKVGGFRHDSITEDLDIIVRMRKLYSGNQNRFRVLPVITCYTQVPKTKKHLMVQRIRWQMGLVETLSKNLDMIFNPTHGLLGMIAIPYSWMAEVLSPLLEITSFVVIPFALIQGWINLYHVIGFLMAGLVFNLCLTTFGIYLDNRHVTRNKNWSYRSTCLHTLLFHFGYKQLTSWWRLLALFKSMKTGYHWGDKPRQEIIHQNF